MHCLSENEYDNSNRGCCSGGIIRSMWYSSRKLDIEATPGILDLISESLWKILCDVNNWYTWDDGLISSNLDNPSYGIRDGATGQLIMKERGQFTFTLVDLDLNAYFAYGASSHWFWDISISDDNRGITLEMGVVISGWAAPIYKLLILKECEESFERALLNLKDQLENRQEMVQVMS